MPENCAAIVIAAKHHELIKVKDTRGTTNTVGALRCKFQFRTEDWLHSAKTAMFCNGDAVAHPEVINNAISVPLDADDECPVPYEVLTDTLPYSVGVWGVTKSGLRVVSNWLVFNAQVGCYTEGNAPEDPEQTVYDEILLISNDAVSAANEVTQRANNGEFDGKSAYEVALDNGFVGSQTEWLASLVGKRGEKGDQGIQGPKGDAGSQGPKGDKGDRGEQGAQGVQGVKGDKGDKGDSGYTPIKGKDYFDGTDGKDGANGKDGYTPVKGVDYFDGKDGAQGAKGDPGAKGDRGEKGDKGDAGAPGANGKDGYTPVKGVDYFDGQKGDKGDKGDQGEKGSDGHTPVKGTDYFTEEDKQTIINTISGDIQRMINESLGVIENGTY